MVPLTASAARITLVAMTDDAHQTPAVVAPHKKVGMLPPYAAGKPPVAVPGLHPYKLSSNENHLPPLPGVAEAITVAGASPANYPDPKSTGLVADIAAELGVDPAEVVPGAGASEMAIARAVAAYGAELRGLAQHSARLFAAALEVVPRTLTQNAGGNAMRVLTELRVRVPTAPCIAG